MEQFAGKKIFGGVAIGKIFFYAKEQNMVKRTKMDDVDAECERYEQAKSKAIEQLNALHAKAMRDVGEASAQIFEVHAMMLEDGDYNDSVYNLIKSQSVNAEYAVATTGDNFADMFANMDDERTSSVFATGSSATHHYGAPRGGRSKHQTAICRKALATIGRHLGISQRRDETRH